MKSVPATAGLTITALATALGMLMFAGSQCARADAAATSSALKDDVEDPIVVSHHEINVGSKTLKYSAYAGRLPIRHNETGEVRGKMFFVAYVLDRLPKAPARPLTFLWNGGPGANATLVHLSAFGPKRIKPSSDPGASPDVEWKLEDNQTTWLDQSDLVFVDPIGTGFSRPTKSEYGTDFYSTLGDISSVAEFVRVYLTRFDAWDAPLLIGGESYGVWRAAGVAEALAQRGRKVAGVILISGGIPVGPVLSDEMRIALFVPTRTSAAFFHKKLPPELQTDLRSALERSESWAREEYAPALARRDRLSEPERQNILAQLARFTGIDAALIDPKTLSLARQQFAEQLLRDGKQVLGRFDTRQITSNENRPRADRSIAINKYLR